MNAAFDAIDKTLSKLERLKKLLSKVKTSQVNSSKFCSAVKTTVRVWFENERKALQSQANQEGLRQVDALFQNLLSLSAGRSLKTKYQTILSELKKRLISLRSDHGLLNTPSAKTNEVHPDFSTLIHDQEMRTILSRRWAECSFCIQSMRAPLSAVVMMGGMVEGLMLARVHSAPDKGKVFNAKAAPKDKSHKTANLKEWTLNNYIDVAHEIGWISQTAKDISVILRDYRNYIHPHKEYSEKITLSAQDAVILWDVCKSIARQILVV
jgi:hypothetical protein